MQTLEERRVRDKAFERFNFECPDSSQKCGAFRGPGVVALYTLREQLIACTYGPK